MHLYNVLIIDDEPYIVHSLSDLLSSQKDLDLNIRTAYSAEEALPIFEKQRIDILLSDIQMKNMSGIDLIKTVRKRWPTCKLLLITAYSNFDYIYEATQLGAVSYILKTEKDEHIIAEVKKAIGMIEDELDQVQLITANSKSLQEVMDFAKRDLFFSLLNNSNDFSKSDQLQTMKILGFQEPYNRLCLLCGRLTNFPSYDKPENTERIAKAFYAIKMIMSNYITSGLAACACEDRHNMIYWIMQHHSDEKAGSPQDNFISWLSGMLETVQGSCIKTAGIQISFVLCGSLDSPALLADAYRESSFFIRQSNQSKNDYIYSFNLNEKRVELFASCDMELLCKQLECQLEKEEYAKFLVLFHSICSMGEHSSLADMDFKKGYYSLTLFLLNTIKHRNLTKRLEGSFPLSQLLNLDSFSSAREAISFLNKFAAIFVEAIQKASVDFYEETISKIRNYIGQHISEEISLQSLSEMCGYNTAYLSRLFHKETGQKLSDFIAEQRMDYIKKMMCDRSLTFSDIMERTSFKTRSYFNRFVKRMTSENPQRLREKLLQTYNKLNNADKNQPITINDKFSL